MRRTFGSGKAKGRAGRPRSEPCAPGAPQIPSGKSPAHFALMRASSSRLERATTGKLSRRANGLRASITPPAVRRGGGPPLDKGGGGGGPPARPQGAAVRGGPRGGHPPTPLV